MNTYLLKKSDMYMQWLAQDKKCRSVHLYSFLNL